MTQEQANEIARPYLKHDTVIVFSDGVIGLNGDIKKAIQHAEENKLEAFIIKPIQEKKPDKIKK